MTPPSGERAQLVVAGEPVGPGALATAAVHLDAEPAEAVRRAAYEHGVVVEHDGLSLVGVGLAARIELPSGLACPGAAREAARLLSAVNQAQSRASRAPRARGVSGGRRTTGGPGCDDGGRAVPVAVGALPFDPTAPGVLAIPAIAVVAADKPSPEGTWAVVVGPAGEVEERCEQLRQVGPDGIEGAGGALGDPSGGELPDRFELSSPGTHAAFRRLVAEAVEAISHGLLEKVVLAREVDVRANRPFRQDDLLGRLRALHPSCAAFAVDGFIGASPELLCRKVGTRVTSIPLAGTVARSGDPEEDGRLAAALLASQKDRAEHEMVVRAILEALRRSCSRLEASPEPTVLELRNVAHLATTITGELALPPAPATPPSALELAATLHPTPAVGGWPVAAALAYLTGHEGLDRGRYAGPVGYVDAWGDGEWWVGIRSAMVDGATARLLAGVGVVAGSDPWAELVETQLKLQALLAVAVRP